MMSQRQCTRYQRRLAYGVVPLIALFFAVAAASPRSADPVRVLAAVTLKPALDAIAAKYDDGKVVVVYGPCVDGPRLARIFSRVCIEDQLQSCVRPVGAAPGRRP
jgi:hypothetical protein